MTRTNPRKTWAALATMRCCEVGITREELRWHVTGQAGLIGYMQLWKLWRRWEAQI